MPDDGVVFIEISVGRDSGLALLPVYGPMGKTASIVEGKAINGSRKHTRSHVASPQKSFNLRAAPSDPFDIQLSQGLSSDSLRWKSTALPSLSPASHRPGVIEAYIRCRG